MARSGAAAGAFERFQHQPGANPDLFPRELSVPTAVSANAQGVQRSSDSPGMVQFASEGNNGYGRALESTSAAGPLYIACWAENASNGTAYLSATFESHAVWKSRKEFRNLVAKRYGPVSEAHCAGNASSAKLDEMVQQWKTDARATTTAVVDTGWEP
jgi:hypothetical protein